MATMQSKGRIKKSAGSEKSNRIKKGKALQKVKPLSVSLNFTKIETKNIPL